MLYEMLFAAETWPRSTRRSPAFTLTSWVATVYVPAGIPCEWHPSGSLLSTHGNVPSGGMAVYVAASCQSESCLMASSLSPSASGSTESPGSTLQATAERERRASSQFFVVGSMAHP